MQERGVKLSTLSSLQDHSVTGNCGDHTNTERDDVLVAIETHHPSGVKVHMDENCVLIWPVMFMYPEYREMDFIESFSENERYIFDIF